MKGKVISVNHRQYEYQGQTRDVYDVIVDIGDDKKKKYQCHSKRASDFTTGQEIEYTEESKGDYTDNEGITRTNWKMILPKDSTFQQGKYQGKPVDNELQFSTMGMSYSKDFTGFCIAHGFVTDGEAAQTLLIDAFRLITKEMQSMYQELKK